MLCWNMSCSITLASYRPRGYLDTCIVPNNFFFLEPRCTQVQTQTEPVKPEPWGAGLGLTTACTEPQCSGAGSSK